MGNTGTQTSETMKKITITQAARQLAAKGVTFIGAAKYDLENKTAYYIIEQDGEQRTVSATEVKNIIR
jgi:hypothetical protein|tara:strand:- start:2598 stop:2801 length:204 start_codon:yes stop_codon:yes gene_type:complete